MTRLDLVSRPISAINAEMTVPGDKSISHRAIILGAIAKGITTINHFLAGQDCLATLTAFQAMGVTIDRPTPEQVIIQGVGKYGLQPPLQFIDCGNSGTCMRLLAGLLAAQSFTSQLRGDESLQKRPMARISQPLKQMGADIITNQEKPPLLIHGKNSLQGIYYQMPQASAQVKSCLLLAGMYAKGKTIVIEPNITRDHTERMLIAFSYPIQKKEKTSIINARSECLGANIAVPGDLSSAAFFIVLATLIKGSKLVIKNVGVNPTRTGVIHILQQMGADIKLENLRLWGQEPVADIKVSAALLRGINISTSLIPLAIDEFPILFIAAACAEGETYLPDAQELRVKESDRIATMVAGLQTLGIRAFAKDDGIVIHGGKIQGGIVNSYHDHRVAMAFAIAGAVAEDSVTITHCEQVASSFPNFVQTANQINMAIKIKYDD